MSEDKPGGFGSAPNPKESSADATVSEDEAHAIEDEAHTDPSPQAGRDACQNCGTSLAGKYCHNCGQRHLPRLRLRDLGRHFLKTILDIDDLGAGLRRTFSEGLRSPGALARQYVDGKRKQVVNPIGYFLIATTFAFVIYGLFRAEWVQGQAEVMRAQWQALGVSPEEIFGEGSPLRDRYGWTSASDLAEALFSVVQQIQTYLSVLACLVAAGALAAVFAGPTYAELVVFELYTVGHANLLQALLAPVLQAWSPAAIFAAGPALLIGLHVYSGPGFFGRTWKGWVGPPLAIIAALVAQYLLSLVGGFLWGFLAHGPALF